MICKTLKLSCHIKELNVDLWGPPAMDIIRRIARAIPKHKPLSDILAKDKDARFQEISLQRFKEEDTNQLKKLELQRLRVP